VNRPRQGVEPHLATIKAGRAWSCRHHACSILPPGPWSRFDHRIRGLGAPFPTPRPELGRPPPRSPGVVPGLASTAHLWLWLGWVNDRVLWLRGRPSPTRGHACSGRARHCWVPAQLSCGPDPRTPGDHRTVASLAHGTCSSQVREVRRASRSATTGSVLLPPGPVDTAGRNAPHANPSAGGETEDGEWGRGWCISDRSTRVAVEDRANPTNSRTRVVRTALPSARGGTRVPLVQPETPWPAELARVDRTGWLGAGPYIGVT
jgi:hypothetical protein